jgi:excinuclease ABC subunit C
MKKAAAETDFDRAAEIRDRLQALEASQVHQHVIFHDQRDVDVVGMERQGQSMSVVILTLREGKILGKREVLCELVDEDHAAEILETILLQHYSTGMVFIPPQVLLPIPLPTQESLRKTLAETSGHKVTLLCPSRGGRASLVELAQQNAASHLQQMYSKQSATERLLAQIQQEFSLSTSPHRIECYDISNMQGTDAVGSQVTFIDGQPAKQFYRKYKIKFVEGPNDFAMLQEVLSRRFREADPVNYPQLVLIDGGKGQLSSVEAVMNFLNLREIPLASIAKVPEDGLNKNILTDRIFIPGRKNPLNLRQDNPVLRLMQQMRDEAHRFAVAYHHKTKQKRTIISELSQIPGVGPKRQKQLLQKFGSVETIKQKTVVELQAAGTIDQKTAQKIYDYFHRTA